MIAITGANGLLGSFITKKLVEENLPVLAVIRKNSNTDSLSEVKEKINLREADVLDVPALTDAFHQVKAVIHTAAIVSFNPRQTRQMFKVNVEGTKNVVNACLVLEIPRLIHISSVSALGRIRGGNTIDEESKWANSPLNSDYAESKYLAELEIYRGMEEGLSVSIVNPSVILAPTDWAKSSAQIFRYVWDEKPFYSEGSLNYVDVRDVAEMVFRLFQSNDQGQKFIANAGILSIKNFFEEIGRRFDKKAPSVKVSRPWIGLAARWEEIRSWLAGTEPLLTRQTARMAKETFYYTNQRAKEHLGMHFRTLEETLDWCCTQYLRRLL
jgi:dihydroflavonol-4-reductase